MNRTKVVVAKNITYKWSCPVCQQLNEYSFNSLEKYPEELVCSTCDSKLELGVENVWWYYHNDKESQDCAGG